MKYLRIRHVVQFVALLKTYRSTLKKTLSEILRVDPKSHTSSFTSKATRSPNVVQFIDLEIRDLYFLDICSQYVHNKTLRQ